DVFIDRPGQSLNNRRARPNRIRTAEFPATALGDRILARMTPSPLTYVRIVLTLLFGFALGMHVAALLHELGHALGARLSGAPVDAIEIWAPMPAGQVLPRTGNHAYAWGGVAFGA